MKEFLEKAKIIVAEHKAQYQGVYYMKGGALGEAEKAVKSVVSNPIVDTAAEVATAVVAPEFLPAVVAGADLAQGKSVGKSLTAGAEALAGQEVAGALGIGSGNPLVNENIGTLTPQNTGLPDVGSAVSNLYSDSKDSVTTALGGTSNPTLTDTGTGVNTNLSQTSEINTPVSGQLDNVGANASLTSAPTIPSNSTVTADTSGIQSSQPSTAPASTSSSESSWVPSKKTAAAAAIPLGELAYQAIKGPDKLPSASSALQQGGAATAPLLALEQSAANQATTRQLTAPQQATINAFIQNQQNALISQLAQEGVADPTKDSRYIQGMQNIQQQAIAQAQQYISQAIQTATSAGGAASGNLAQVANQQIQNDTAFQNSLSQAFGSLGSIMGGVPNIKIGTSA